MRLTGLIAGILAASFACAFAAPSRAAPDSAIRERLDWVIDQAIADRRLVGAVVIVARDGAIVYQRAAGLSDREVNTQMRADSIFPLASMSKPRVTVAAIRLSGRFIYDLRDAVYGWSDQVR